MTSLAIFPRASAIYVRAHGARLQAALVLGLAAASPLVLADPLTGPRPTSPASSDRTGPILSGVTQTRTGSGSFIVSGNVTDNRALTGVTVKEAPDGARWPANLVGTWTAATFTVTVPPRNSNNNTVYVTAYDETGNQSRITLVLAGSTPPANTAPVVELQSPASNTTYAAGDTISVALLGQDAEDGALGASASGWWIDFHHDTHSHPARALTSGLGGSFTVPRQGEISSNVWYRIHARVTDSGGLTSETVRDVLPRKAAMTIATVPAGLALTMDGQPIGSGAVVTGVVGMERQIGTTAEQTFNGRRWVFSGWSDGGSIAHTILTPDSATTYTATFRDNGPAVSNQPPVVSVSAGARVRVGEIAMLTANASDSDGSIASVSFQDGSTLLGQVTSPPYAWSWTPRQASEVGTHQITATAVDNLGASSTSAPVQIVVEPGDDGSDTLAPTVSIVSPANLSTIAPGLLSATVTANDDVGVASVEVLWDGVSVATLTAAPYVASLDVSQDTAGQHVLQVQAHDAAGNASPWASAVINLGGSNALPTSLVRDDNWITGLRDATAFIQLPDGRILVSQQGGLVRVVKNGVLLPAPLHQFNVHQFGESGLIGLVAHPDFSSNGYVYAHYTVDLGDGTYRNQIVRITVQGDVSTGTETTIFRINPLSYVGNHNGGVMAFGSDHSLYIGVGAPSPYSSPQELTTMQGKILRINDDGSIPLDNPFYDVASGDFRAIWALGLRNPFSLAIEPVTDRMHINDVGEASWEEVNLGVAGANYGWASSEGPSNNSGIQSPIFAYPHSSQPSGAGGFFSGQAVTGAAFYGQGGTFPQAYQNSYYFTDYVQGWIARMDLKSIGQDTGRRATVSRFASGFTAPVGLLKGNDGALYVLTQTSISRLRTR